MQNTTAAWKMKAGPYVKIRKGTKMRIVVGEAPGGMMGGGLFIQKKGKQYRKRPDGEPILPPFSCSPLRPEDITRFKNHHYPIEVNDVPIFTIIK